MTLPAAFRKKLGLKPGEKVLVEMRGDQVIIQKDNWLERLRSTQQKNKAHLQNRGIKPLSDEELDNAINSAADEATAARFGHTKAL